MIYWSSNEIVRALNLHRVFPLKPHHRPPTHPFFRKWENLHASQSLEYLDQAPVELSPQKGFTNPEIWDPQLADFELLELFNVLYHHITWLFQTALLQQNLLPVRHCHMPPGVRPAQLLYACLLSPSTGFLITMYPNLSPQLIIPRLPHSNQTYFQCNVAICRGECAQLHSHPLCLSTRFPTLIH